VPLAEQASGLLEFSDGDGGNTQAKNAPASVAIVELESAALRLGDSTSDRQAKSHSTNVR
jgi:hypothetical protein